MNGTEVVVWYEGGCSSFGAPDMSFSDGVIHDDNTVDWSDPDDGIYWTRSYVNADTAAKRDARPSYRVIDGSGEVVGEAATLLEAQRLVDSMAPERREGATLCEVSARRPLNDFEILSNRIRLVSGSELKGALAVEVRGMRVLERDPHSERVCCLEDVTRLSLAVGRDDEPEDEEPEVVELSDDEW